MYHLPELRRVFLRVPWQLALLALPIGVYAQSYRRDQGLVAEIAAPTESLATWICIAVVLQMFYRFVRQENRAVRLLNDSSYSIYLFHHAIMVAFVFLLLPLPLGPAMKFFLVCILSLAAAAALHVHVVRRSELLRLLFNGVAPRPRRVPEPQPAGTSVPSPAPVVQYQESSPRPAELALSEQGSGH
jgi:glucan biosynthesis protein C